MYGRSFKLLLLTSAMAVVLPSWNAAVAQEAQSSGGSPAIELDTVSVQSDRQTGTGPVNGYVATQTTTGMKTDVPITEIPQSVSVIGRDEIDDRKALKVDEALRYTAGVHSSPYGGPDPDTDWFYIRGFNATQTGIFLDSLSLYSYGFGGFQVDPFMLERIEVLKGPASVLYGGSSPGGLVNLVSKRPREERFGYAEVGINNFGNAYFAFDINEVYGAADPLARNPNDPGLVTKAPAAATDPVWMYRITGRIAGGDTYTDYSNDLRGVIMPQVTYRPSQQTEVTVYAQIAALDQVNVGGGFLPYYGTVANAPFGKISRDAYFGEPDLDNSRYTQLMVGYELKHEFENDWIFNSSARYGYLNKREIGPYPYGYYDPTTGYGGNPLPLTSNNLLNRIGFEGHSEVNSFATDNHFRREFTTGAVAHDFIVGVDYTLYHLDNVQASGGATPISATDPVYGVPQGATAVYMDQTLTQQQLGGYLQDQLRFGDGWIVTLNGRYDYVNTESESPATLAFSPNYETNDSALTGRAGLGYEFANGVTPYVAVSSFFNPVVGVDVTNTGFKPEEGYQYEAGIKYQPTFVDALITASVFQITRQNVTVPDVDNIFFDTQLGEVRSTGFELEAKANVTKNFRLIGTFTVLDMEITNDTNAAIIGNEPMLVPDVMASAWADYKFDQGPLTGVSVGGGVRYIGSSWIDDENTLQVPSVTLFDAAIRYERDSWGVALNLNNIFDEVYVSGCQGLSSCGYGDSRTLTLSAHYKW
ncbi:TonB-dependent siderophore receptor [Ancylobacter defluvii]|uniref:Ligand-gated channel n=1 Tax=Ancylobacter defluvii TaxID=1282440 RepID=A0A9W6JTT1_9HYPH|nr:TonB-dependent siderophore receptor [Ancylobacter defluvii]MBS7590009.1 TonB-dependent siderophore receptor [Ancylobacter defluvii]GLK83137.1 ligand-gated channel [Ancylobacter defluvii]